MADIYNRLRKRGIIYDMIYYIALSFSLCLCLLIDKRYLMSTNKTVYISAKKLMIDKIGFKRSLLCFLSSLPLFLLSALRYGIGTDYFYGYVPIFQTINSGHIQNTRAEKDMFFSIILFLGLPMITSGYLLSHLLYLCLYLFML